MIEIPKEFEGHYVLDRFEDSLQRLRRDVHKAMIGKIGVLSDKYEIEVLDMLTEAFLNSKTLPKGHGRLIDADYLDITTITTDDYSGNEVLDIVLKEDVDAAPTVIEADKAGD